MYMYIGQENLKENVNKLIHNIFHIHDLTFDVYHLKTSPRGPYLEIQCVGNSVLETNKIVLAVDGCV